MDREIISTDNAPAAVSVYSQAISANGFLFVSGQVGLVPGTKELVTSSIEEETRQVLTNLKNIVEAAGSSLDKAVKVDVFMTDINNYGRINEVYAEFFSNSRPARAAVAVKELPIGANVEIAGIFLL